MRAASQLPEGGPLMWMMPLHLHVNKKSDYYPHAFFKKPRGYCNRFCPSVMLSPPKPLDEMCELLT